jgi:hypothetical protein
MTSPTSATRIAALVATPSKGNTGMRVVNDALACWLASHGLLAQTDWFAFEAPPAFLPAEERAAVRSVLELDPQRYGRIVVWGDFLIDRNWLAKACERVAAERAAPLAEVRRHAEAVIFGGADAAPPRIVVGQCFLVSDDAYDADAAYQARFARLAREARILLLRDPVSAARAHAFGGAALHALPPLDAALLRPTLRARAGDAARSLATPRSGYGIFFGRTAGGLAAKLGMLAAARGAGPAHALRWLPGREVPGWLRVASSPREVAPQGGVEAWLDALRRLSFVLTDTYHLALVCWSIGVPALCLGRGAQRFRHSTHDKKKELFFLAQRIERFHVYAEDGFAAARAQTRERIAEIAARDPGPGVARQIAAQAEPVIAALDAALGSP